MELLNNQLFFSLQIGLKLVKIKVEIIKLGRFSNTDGLEEAEVNL